MLSGPVSHARFVAFFTFVVALAVFRTPSAKAPTPPPKHGLTGSYYVGNLILNTDVPADPESLYWSQVWFSKNDFDLPRAFTSPAATHVDPQVAFGQGKGFNVKDPNLPLMTWWPTSFAVPAGRDVQSVRFVAATWKGYIHLPKPGTYYFSTVSWFGPSAVYLNQARVALNGIGGVQVADPFSYAKEDVQDFVEKLGSGRWDLAFNPNSRDQYVVPVSIDASRDLPIEVQYQCWRGCFGIDLFWVTPDAPRDASGKPIAKIVPSDALYTEPPGTIEKPAVRTANSTIEADHLYFPTEYTEGAVTLKIRLADKNGNPVAGKRVYVSSLTSYGGGDSIVQPDKPTDEKGETTAKIRTGEGFKVAHDSTIFATDVTDLVDAAQVAHVTFQQVDWNFFDTFAPYWDQRFLITPNPPVVARPILIKTALKNHSKFPAKVTVTFLTTDENIGFSNWAEIAKVEDLTLKPGESKEVSTTFTPKEVMGHKCYKVEVEGEYIAMNRSGEKVLAVALLPLTSMESAAAASPPEEKAKASQNKNSLTVAAPTPPPECGHYFNGDYEPIKTRYEPTNAENAKKAADDFQNQIEAINKQLAGGGPLPVERKMLGDELSKLYGAMWCMRWMADNPGATAAYNTRKEHNRSELAIAKARRDRALAAWHECTDIPSRRGCTQAEIARWTHLIAELDKLIAELEKLDPSDPNYRRLAVAASDLAPAYMEALRVSLERYQGAQAAGDPEWMARHLTATRLYEKRVADALRREAAQLEHDAQSLPPENPQELANLQANQAKLLERVRQGGPIPPDLRKQLLAKGITEVELKNLEGPRPDFKLPSELKSLKDTLLDLATLNKTFADQWQQLSDKEGDQAASGQQRSQAYAVANPHDKQENIDLFIRPISIPADWKLSVINAEEPTARGQTVPGAKPPLYPVQEVEAGKHYAVTLPAKAQVKVASVLVPVGELGARTTARWAVEGKIGNELIGGMMHEMIVPYIIADLKLPPVGSKEVEEELPVPSRPWARNVAGVAAAIVILGLLAYFLIFWRKRRGTGTPAAS